INLTNDGVPGASQSLVHGRRCAATLAVQQCDRTIQCDLADDLSPAIGTTVVDDDHFERLVILCPNGFERLPDERGAISQRDDNADADHAGGRPAWKPFGRLTLARLNTPP